MSETSARLALPFIVPGQAQKELFHNEALARIDVALHAAVEDAMTQSPPDVPVQGQCWIVAGGATGAWAGQEGTLACWTSGGWRFFNPVPGMMVWNKSEGHWIYWRGTGWGDALPVAGLLVGGVQVVGGRQPAVPSPSGGTTIDQEARGAIVALTAALKTHGLID